MKSAKWNVTASLPCPMMTSGSYAATRKVAMYPYVNCWSRPVYEMGTTGAEDETGERFSPWMFTVFSRRNRPTLLLFRPAEYLLMRSPPVKYAAYGCVASFFWLA